MVLKKLQNLKIFQQTLIIEVNGTLNKFSFQGEIRCKFLSLYDITKQKTNCCRGQYKMQETKTV